MLIIWYVFSHLRTCSFGLATFQVRFNSHVWPGSTGAPGSPQLPCSLSGFLSSPVCRPSFWDMPLDGGTWHVAPSQQPVTASTGPPLHYLLSQTPICICTHFQPLKVLDPKPEPRTEPHPQGLFCDCRPGLLLGPQLCCMGTDTTGCCPAYALLISPERSLGMPERLKELITVVRTGPHKQQLSSNHKLCVSYVPPALWPPLVVASSRTAVGLRLYCLGPGLWAFALYREGKAQRNAVGPARAEEMPPLLRGQGPGMRPRVSRKCRLPQSPES